MDSLTSRNSPTSSPREQKKKKEVKYLGPFIQNEDFKGNYLQLQRSFQSALLSIFCALLPLAFAKSQKPQLTDIYS
ncbi:hypothetical protein TNIN_67191 [Trichonephila inaurata madagascariensis]|uniref:Uncharacterized protein n=1 Tax=Trichonephila inaurata madagascariensis TaxID=2747483 RepID=A0A8X6JY51_9ARAC|nr:hypothetical protein TNIN_67191 [Trichonephila inaurata madagascariensis]